MRYGRPGLMGFVHKFLFGFIVASFAVSAGAQTPIDRGLLWLSSRVTSEGGAPGRLDASRTALSIVAFEEAGISLPSDRASLSAQVFETTMGRIYQALGTGNVGVLDSLQGPDGSYEGEISLTAWALLAQERYGVSNAAAVTYLESQQNPDGSWGERDFIYHTGLATLALLSVDAGNAAAGDGVDFLLDSQSPDGGWGADLAGSSVALLVLAQRGDLPAAESAAVSFLEAAQVPRWGPFSGRPPSIIPTALAVWSLASVDSTNPAID